MIAKKPEPKRKKIAAAGVHDAQQASSVMLTMKRQRQTNRMLEKLRYHGKAAPMRQSIGI